MATDLSAYYLLAIGYIVTSHHLNWKNKFKFLLRSPLHWQHIARFLLSLKTLGLDFILDKHPRLLEKFSRSYLSVGTDARQTLDKLLAHYRLLGQRLTKDALGSLYDNGLPVCHFILDGEEFECILEYDGRFEKEGEICISLIRRVDRYKIYTLIAVFSDNDVFIGCLQGNRDQEDIVRHVTKAAYGLRPHNLVFFVAQEVARLLGCQKLYGVTSVSHIYQAHARTLNRIGFDYDGFWKELGGTLSDKWYALPASYPRNLLEDVPSKKRMLYRRRYALMDTLAEEIAARMSVAMGNPATVS
jgi:hypothetical protein